MTFVLIENSALFFLGGGWPSIIQVIWDICIYLQVKARCLVAGSIRSTSSSPNVGTQDSMNID